MFVETEGRIFERPLRVCREKVLLCASVKILSVSVVKLL